MERILQIVVICSSALIGVGCTNGYLFYQHTTNVICSDYNSCESFSQKEKI